MNLAQIGTREFKSPTPLIVLKITNNLSKMRKLVTLENMTYIPSKRGGNILFEYPTQLFSCKILLIFA